MSRAETPSASFYHRSVVWLLFLKIFDDRELEWELMDEMALNC